MADLGASLISPNEVQLTFTQQFTIYKLKYYLLQRDRNNVLQIHSQRKEKCNALKMVAIITLTPTFKDLIMNPSLYF